MADTDFNLPPNHHVYSLLAALNAAFLRAHKQLESMGQFGMVNQQTVQSLLRLMQELRATCNSQLLTVLQEREARKLSELHKYT